jgi:hypothetical protein
MDTLQRTVSATPSTGNNCVDRDGILERRIRPEFDEMPGLNLTLDGRAAHGPLSPEELDHQTALPIR